MYVDPVLTQCDSYMCKDHDTIISDLYSNIVNAIVEAGVTAIPQSCTETRRSCGVKATPGWNEYVEPKRQVSLFWHNMWKDQGCPHHGVVADIMRSTRAQYHSAIKWVKQNDKYIRNIRLAESVKC